MSELPYARIYAFKRGKAIQPGCEVSNASGLLYHETRLSNFLNKLMALKIDCYALSVVERPDEVCPDMFPPDCELVLPMPKELRENIEAVINAGKEDEGAKKYPVEHDTRKF